jgi:autotransporter-associated beta strand protein
LSGGNYPTAGGASVEFTGSASSTDASFLLAPGQTSNSYGASVTFLDNSTADNSTFDISAGGQGGTYNASVVFRDSSTAANATLINEPGSGSAGTSAGTTQFTDTATAANAEVILKGGTSVYPSQAVFWDHSDAASATLIAYPAIEGSGGGGGRLDLRGDCVAEQTRVMVFGYPSHVEDGSLDITIHNGPLTIGSLEGNGTVQLGRKSLSVGTRNVSTTFAGQIVDILGESVLTKVGTATLRLTGGSTYGGGTVVSDGTLQIDNTSGSGTGLGSVSVNAGILSGSGIIAGPVTIGTGSGGGAILAPGQGVNKSRALTLQDTLVLKADATYLCKINTTRVSADQVTAAGITIDTNAKFTLRGSGGEAIDRGTSFVVFNNTSDIAISGEFSNLADGATVTLGPNTFEADYQGGDGNDLVLTVITD